jgi:hypothetical protein
VSRLSEQRENEAVPNKSGPRWIWMILALVLVTCAWVGYDLYNIYSGNVSTIDGFAKCLASKGVRMYGAWWCPHCADQKDAFGFAFQYVNYVECGVEGKPRSENEQCKQAGIKNFPTWQFADGSRTEGELTLSVLSQRTGCKLP